ncbi:MAG TPA: DegV family protein [Tissierellia bacterium]|nr:DegV family protein [Tissierellia bacterium]
MNEKTIIVTDSSCDLSADYIKESGVYVIPFTYNLDGNDYIDDFGQTVTYEEFYDRIRNGSMPTTSQITTFTFENTFKELAQQGYSIIYIGFSSALSSTFNNAIMAKRNLLEEDPSIDLTIIDSKSASVGLGAIVYYAAEMLKEGKSKDEIVEWVENNKLKVFHQFTVDSLEHLKRGGRLSAASAAIGTLLDIKPFLIVDDEGKLEVIKKIRGRKKSIKTLLELLKANIINPEEQTIFINHGDCLEDAEYLKDMLLKEVKVKDVMINYVGPIIGTHTGPGMLCMVFLGSDRNIK